MRRRVRKAIECDRLPLVNAFREGRRTNLIFGTNRLA